jgi:hypothetical protein
MCQKRHYWVYKSGLKRKNVRGIIMKKGELGRKTNITRIVLSLVITRMKV